SSYGGRRHRHPECQHSHAERDSHERVRGDSRLRLHNELSLGLCMAWGADQLQPAWFGRVQKFLLRGTEENMNRNRLLVLGIFAMVVALFVSLTIAGVVRRALASTGTPAEAQVVVAAKDLNVGQQITDGDLRMLSMPSTSLPQGAFHKPSDVMGRGVILPMQANQVVLGSKVAGPNEGAGLPAMIERGMRAVSVKVNDVVSVAGFVVPGTRVDVIVTGNPINS